jgi:hypothetical protein
VDETITHEFGQSDIVFRFDLATKNGCMLLQAESKGFLTKVYNIQNHWVSGRCSLSDIQNKKKAARFGNWMFPSSCEGMETPTRLGSLERAGPVPAEPDRVRVSLPSPEEGNRSSFRNAVLSFYFEYPTMKNVQKSSHSECYRKHSYLNKGAKLRQHGNALVIQPEIVG